MTLQITTRRVLALLALGLVCALYFADLTGMGMVSVDEPRYAAIGHEMAASGDWITPRLWGAPWFEKPALLYWMIAAGFRAGLGPELAPRLPVAMLSVAFLIFFWWWLRREWDREIAWYGAAILATSVGWLAYSHTAVTDLPMSAFFSAAVLLAISARPQWIASAACLAFAALGKGLVPMVLFAPVAAMMVLRKDRPSSRSIAFGAAVFAAIAAPWYVLCTIRNGAEFPRVFFLQQTFGRFNSDALQHAQPWWFYAPVALLLLYPWFPLLAVSTEAVADYRARTLGAVTIFGFVFFSAMKNKLPGYLLPLLPAAAALMALGYVRAGRPRWAAAAAISLLGLLPVAARVLPEALSSGLRRAHFGAAAVWWPIPVAIAAAVLCAYWLRGFSRLAAASAIAGCALVWFQFAVFGAIDRAASARPVWRAGQGTCAPPFNRGMQYGLQYYAGHALPPCESGAIDRNRPTLYGTERR